MKKLHVLIITLAVLGIAVQADAFFGRRGGCFRDRCEKKERCEPCEKPKCTVECETFYKPCKKWILVNGTCPWEKRTKCCTTYSNHCVGECEAFCENAANEDERYKGEMAGE